MEPSTFEREMKKFDSKLRLRRAKASGAYFIERKARRETACIPKPTERGSIDRWIRDSEGYVLVYRMSRGEINKETLHRLRLSDMWQYRSPMTRSHKDLLEKEIEEEGKREARLDREHSNMLEAVGKEAYDKQMSRQGDVVYPGLKTTHVAGNK